MQTQTPSSPSGNSDRQWRRFFCVILRFFRWCFPLRFLHRVPAYEEGYSLCIDKCQNQTSVVPICSDSLPFCLLILQLISLLYWNCQSAYKQARQANEWCLWSCLSDHDFIRNWGYGAHTSSLRLTLPAADRVVDIAIRCLLMAVVTSKPISAMWYGSRFW